MSESKAVRRALYPGTFDPITNGHEDLVRRAARLFEEVVVAVAKDTDKQPVFPLAQRASLAAAVLADLPNVRVLTFEGLLIDCVHREGANVILRGLRAISDFEHEFQLASINRRMDPQIETLFLMTSDQHTFLSSSLVREISRLGGDVNAFVHPLVAEALLARYRQVADNAPSLM